MSDDIKSDDNHNGTWVMPEPIFRTSPGHTPNAVKQTDYADDITTQPGFTDEDMVDTLIPDFTDSAESPADEPVADDPVKVTAAPPKPKKSGCARSFLTLLSLIVLAIIGVVIALIYFIFYYKSADTGTF
ncbi:MAG: hypothetical protein ACRENF_05750 [Thermodesulfobacteriota bacterium]